jgi:hypothetical protein
MPFEGVDQRYERDIALQFCGAALEHHEAVRERAVANVGQQRRFPDASLAANHEDGLGAARDGVDYVRDRLELRFASAQTIP